MRVCAALSALALCVACSGNSSSPPPADFPELSDPDDGKVKRPRGWKAYTGERITDVSTFGPARNATVYAHDGKAIELADLWAEGNLVLVFYRGHW